MTDRKNRLILLVLVLSPAILLGLLLIPAFPGRLGQTKRDMLYINAAMFEFHKITKTLPEGDSAMIFQSLMGSNSLKRVYLEAGKVDANNLPLDNWGTPYQISVMEGKTYSIHCAGKDKQFGNADDYVFDGEKQTFTVEPTP